MKEERVKPRAQPSLPRIAPVHRPIVSVIVTARNYCRFLKECLGSCLAQTDSSVEVIYSDDGSADESVSVARDFPLVKTIARRDHTGVVASRNRAVAVSRGDILIHVDGDDRLPPDFVAKHRSALRPGVPFVYGPAQAFGELDTLWSVQPWGDKPIWEMNFCNTSSAIRRVVFEAAGGWQENPTGTLWDWDLFLRASRFGEPAPSTAVLQYRQHAESWSHTHERESQWDRRIKMLADVRRARVRLSIGCIYSGRLPGLLPKWFNAVCANVARASLPEPPDLLILDNSPNGADGIYSTVADRASLFSAVRILPHPQRIAWQNEMDRRNKVASFMAGASNRILDETRGELVWLIEDDVVPPPTALRDMFNAATEGYPMPAAVFAPYRNRHTGMGWVAAKWLRGHGGAPADIRDLPSEPTPVDLAGTGCLLFWRSLCPPRFEPFLKTSNSMIAAHDWAFTDAIRAAGRKTILLPATRCRHYITTEQWV